MRRTALVTAATAIVLDVAALVLDIMDHSAVHALASIGDLIFPVVALVIMRAQPRNTVAWAFLASGVLNSINHLGQGIAYLGLHSGWAPSLSTFGAWLTSWTWFPGLFLVITIGLLHFPDGRPLPGRWRWADRAAVTIMVGVGLCFGFGAWGLPAAEMMSDGDPTPYGWRKVVFTIGEIGFGCMLPVVIVAVAALVVRWRRSGPVGRQQIRWVAAAGSLAVITEAALDIVGSTGVQVGDTIQTLVETVVFGLIAVATAFAILRHKLYEIDRIVSRTVGYAAVTGTLVGVYSAIVAIAGTFIPPHYGSIGVAAATLAAAALFVPLRRRIQHLVDRRFDRARYDAGGTVTQFALAIRHELSETELSAELLRTVNQALAPTTASVWIPERAVRVT